MEGNILSFEQKLNKFREVLNERPVCSILNAEGNFPVLLTAEHASCFIPDFLDGLGLDENTLYQKHYAYDIGVYELTKRVAEILNAPAIVNNYSRLIIDVVRLKDHPTSISTEQDGQVIYGNIHISDEEKEFRYRSIQEVWHNTIRDFQKIHQRPVIIPIHTYNKSVDFDQFGRPGYGKIRPLYSFLFERHSDHNLANALRESMIEQGIDEKDIAFNDPYDFTESPNSICTSYRNTGASLAVYEIRNDLTHQGDYKISPEKVEKQAQLIAKTIESGFEKFHNDNPVQNSEKFCA